MYRKRYAHVSKAMQAASAARVKVVLASHTQCPKCNQLVAGVKDGVFPVHYVIGKIPCGWQEAQPNPRVQADATLFGMRVEIANWLKPGQWFIRPSRRDVNR